MPLTETDFRTAGNALGVQVAAVKAITEVESAGSGFLADGRPKVLFERHIMYRQARAKFGQAKADAFARKYPHIISQKPGGYGKQSAEPDRMAEASDLIDRECALESASWGLFQVMGYHWRRLRYPSLQTFINAMYRDEAAHLESFVRFIEADPALHRALKALDWAQVGRRYNGPNYAANSYDVKLSQAYKRAGGAIA